MTMGEQGRAPWYRRAYRWGQTNLTEIDPIRYDAAFWRDYWRRTRVQGIIVNAGGIVAYYPSENPLQYRARFLGDRDLFGEIIEQAHQDGLVVLARMDCSRTDERVYLEHPDWFVVDAEGRPLREGPHYVTCINGPYYEEHIPAIIREIATRYHPEGFTDNSWSGTDRSRICQCSNCARRFREATGLRLPAAKNWDDPAYRQWILWSYARRVEVWELFNRVAREAGGPDCLYLGMLGGDPVGQGARLRDLKAICERSEIIMLDHQARSPQRGFHGNAETGLLLHGLLGWDKLIPESTAMYQAQAGRSFRLAAKPAAEARMWAIAGWAGGIQPWWHHIGAYHEDRRQYRTAEALFRWHEANQEYLVNRRPLATIGVVWSQTNADFYGRDTAQERVSQPAQGIAQALVRARIPFLPVHADHIERDAPNLAALVLPNIGALTDEQCQAIRRFVEAGGGLVATGESSLYDRWGDRRPDFALADLFGVHATGTHHGTSGPADPAWDAWATHTYLRLHPELRAGVYGPRTGTEPTPAGERHSVLQGFEETDILPFGGRLEVVTLDPAAQATVPLTYIPPFPIYPPETAWMRHPATSLPALVLREHAGGRVAYFAADIDRCLARDNLPDHARLLANTVRWAARERIPLRVEGPGLLGCHPYRQDRRCIVHLLNLTYAETMRPPIEEALPTGPYAIRLQLPAGVAGRAARLLVAEREVPVTVEDGWARLEVPGILEHEVLVIT